MQDDEDEVVVATAEIGPHLRTWRMFVARLRWLGLAAIALLAVLLVSLHH